VWKEEGTANAICSLLFHPFHFVLKEYLEEMVRMTVLASGSRGNCTVITAGRTRVLVDAGVSCREILRRACAAGEDIETLDAILITHEHQDHVQGLSVLARKFGIPVYFTEATHRAWVRWMTPQRRMSYADWLEARRAEAARKVEEAALVGAAPEANEANPFYREGALKECADEAAELAGELEAQAGEEAMQEAGGAAEKAARHSVDPCALPAVEYFRAGKPFVIGDLKVSAFTIPHDAADPVGFVLEGEGVRIGFATDLGYMPANVAQQLRGSDCLLLESNHDLDMLRDGPYPWSVKQRVLSRVGHLSNAAAAEFLEKGYDGGARYIVLAHLSQSNNLPELARIAAEWALRERMHLLANKVVVAAQEEPTESICF
jgi:phosphoribosyl 1,2-cyclic phosphodiesterase